MNKSKLVTRALSKPENTVQDLVEWARKNDVFSEAEETEALFNWQAVQIRRAIKQETDDHGVPIIFNIKRTLPDGQVTQCYVQDSLLSEAERQQVVNYNADRSIYYAKVAAEVKQRGIDAGQNITLPPIFEQLAMEEV